MDFVAIRAVPILDVAQELGLQVKGRKAMCFSGHDEKTPSLSFWLEKNSWKCFGCGLGGTPIDLARHVLGLSSAVEAAKWIDHRFRLGAAKTRWGRSKGDSAQRRSHALGKSSDNTPKSRKSSDPEVYQWLVEHCPLGDSGYRYLRDQRKLSRNTIEKFHVCELRSPKRAFSSLVESWGVERLKKCGLGRKNKFPKDAHDDYCLIWFRHCLLFPFLKDGEVEYIQARFFADRGPRYIGLSGIEKPIFNVDELPSAPKNSDVYICEGVTDTLAAHEIGLRAVGILGAASFRHKWVPLFKNVNPLVVPDNDRAGQSFRKSVQNAFALHGRVVNSVSIGTHNDLSELVVGSATGGKTSTP